MGHQLQGKTWDERGQGVQQVRTKIAQGDMGSLGVEDFFHAGCCVSRMALKDKVMPVFFDGLDLCKLLLGDFVVKHEVSQYKITGAIDMLVPIIVAKTSDRNARSIEGTRQALVFLARQPYHSLLSWLLFVPTSMQQMRKCAVLQLRS